MKYLTPKQHLRRLRFERFTTWLKYVGLSFIGTCTLWVLIAIKPDFTFNDRLNECLQNHSLNYCNNNVR